MFAISTEPLGSCKNLSTKSPSINPMASPSKLPFILTGDRRLGTTVRTNNPSCRKSPLTLYAWPCLVLQGHEPCYAAAPLKGTRNHPLSLRSHRFDHSQ